MSDPAKTVTVRLPTRSMGAKLLVVCVLVLLMMIPAFFVSNLLGERAGRAAEVTNELGELMGGRQTFSGPMLAVPYTAPAHNAADTPAGSVVSGVYLIAPAQADDVIKTASEVRKRSLFRTSVYKADLDLKATFDLTDATRLAPKDAVFDWTRAEMLVGVSDARGAQSDITLTIGDRKLQLAPASTLSEQPIGGDGSSNPAAAGGGRPLHMFAAPMAGIAQPGARFSAEAAFRFTGAQRLAVLATGKTTQVKISGDWPSPSFDGGFLPAHREVSDHGFSADWSIPFIARGVPAEGFPDTLQRLGQNALGVSFVEPANPYQSVERSVKYALLFIGLVFLAYFIFETLSDTRVHPAQYVLIGLAQTIFYLLLLSAAERVGFDAGFLIAAMATVGLISVYAFWVFASRVRGLQAFAAFSLLYGLIYVLMRLEDTALLVGAVASFAAIAAVMYFTRKINWYGVTDSAVGRPTPPVGKTIHG